MFGSSITGPSAEDCERAKKWAADHAFHVAKLVMKETASYAPAGGDRSRPELWTAAHWRWLLQER